ARRVLSSIPLLLGVSILLYAVLHLAPGGPLDVYADNPSVSPEALKNLGRELGLDQPVPVQYLRWLRALLRGEWGYSIRSGRPVTLDI
ncbi:diguanylate cyclase, partial [Escherichia coli]|nr:diguanylate cyclase [Escherichia coli]